MFKQIKETGVEITTPADNDLILIQQTGGTTGRIKRKNYLSGVTNSSYIQLLDKKASGTNGGQAVLTQWATRTINTINTDETGAVGLANNVITLPAGTYEISLLTTFYALADTKIRLYNNTDSAVILYGLNSYFQASTAGAAFQSCLQGKFTLPSSKNLVLQYWSKAGGNLNQYNFGGAVGDGSPEIYTVVDLWKAG